MRRGVVMDAGSQRAGRPPRGTSRQRAGGQPTPSRRASPLAGRQPADTVSVMDSAALIGGQPNPGGSVCRLGSPLVSDHTVPVPSVLIVDDHAGFRARARRMLESEGWHVAGEAADGASAVQAAAELQPDVILLDVHLPDASGLDVAGELVASAGSCAVVLTSSRDASDYAEA